MMIELLHSPYPDGYGEALLPLAECKAHLRVDGDEDDDLIAALRDAAIEFVERYCSVRLLESAGWVWKANSFPSSNAMPLALAVSPVKAIDSIRWRDTAGGTVDGDAAGFRVSSSGSVLPFVGQSWPSGVGGSVEITFTAGHPAGAAPKTLLAAARLFLGHLYANREAVTDQGDEGEVPLGVHQLCGLHRRILI